MFSNWTILKYKDHATILSRKFVTCKSHIYFSFNNKNCFINILIENTYACGKKKKGKKKHRKKRHFLPQTIRTLLREIPMIWANENDVTVISRYKWSCMFPCSELVLLINLVLIASLRLNSFVWLLVVLVKRKIHIQVLCLIYCNMDRWNQAYIVYVKKCT